MHPLRRGGNICRRSVPVFGRSHKRAIELSRPAWVQRWPLPSDHTGSASTNTGERAARWQPVPWSASSSLWAAESPSEAFNTPPWRLVALLRRGEGEEGGSGPRAAHRSRGISGKREWRSAPLKRAHVHTHELKGQVFVGVGFCARLCCLPPTHLLKKNQKK